ncbi:MAG: hypothetical protein HC905_00590 [Bacteroidales bacterium]|nr:hypothetical protein [Bacteroidales bacterium]
MADKLKEGYWENKKYGELYYFNMIDHFKEQNLPPSNVKYRFTERHPSLDSAGLLIFGDSFMDFSRMVTFPERLGNELNTKVYYERYDLPLQTFAEKNYKNTKPKIFIYESAERYIPIRFTTPQTYFEGHLKQSMKSVVFHKVMNTIFNSNSEGLYNSMLFQSYATKPIYSFISTFKFDYLGYISNSTPKYAFHDNQAWLFYYEEVDKNNTSFYYDFTDQDIDTYCDNIADLSKKLKEHYNLEWFLCPSPQNTLFIIRF